jgi:hypothetical protein
MKELETKQSNWNDLYNAPDVKMKDQCASINDGHDDFSLLLKQLAARSSRMQSPTSLETKKSNLQKFSNTKLLKCFPPSKTAGRRINSEILRNFEGETVKKRIAQGNVKGGAWGRSGPYCVNQSDGLGPGCYKNSIFDEGKYARPKTSTPKYSDQNKISEAMKFERKMKDQCASISNGHDNIQSSHQISHLDDEPNIESHKLPMKFLCSTRWNDSAPGYLKTSGMRLSHDYDKKMDKHLQFSLNSRYPLSVSQ